MAILIAVTVVSVNDLGNDLKAQQIKAIETRQEFNRKIDSIENQKTQVEDSLRDEKQNNQKLQQENADLKAKLQAKVERESRREANLYAAGNCTWYVKEKVPYIGGTWGNANQWLASAQSDGFETGYAPKDGAIGVSFEGLLGHVVYIESVNTDGSVTISEMNYGRLYAMNTRTVPANSFTYIYT